MKPLNELLEKGLARKSAILGGSMPETLAKAPIATVDRYVAENMPCYLSGLAIPDPETILRAAEDLTVTVAVTPLGNADAPLGDLFVQPHTEQMTVAALVSQLGSPLGSPRDPHARRVLYMQSEDDNRNKEFAVLDESAVPRNICCNLLGEPEAVNLWIGGPGTISRLHNDNYENIYLQLQGTKRIWLIPPSNVHHLNERFLKSATYKPSRQGLELHIDEPAQTVLFPTVSPSDPATLPPSWSNCTVYEAVLRPGQALFIPALWYHQVEIVSEDLNMSVNYWYPAVNPAAWATWDFLRYTSLALRQEYDEVYFDE